MPMPRKWDWWWSCRKNEQAEERGLVSLTSFRLVLILGSGSFCLRKERVLSVRVSVSTEYRIGSWWWSSKGVFIQRQRCVLILSISGVWHDSRVSITNKRVARAQNFKKSQAVAKKIFAGPDLLTTFFIACKIRALASKRFDSSAANGHGHRGRFSCSSSDRRCGSFSCLVLSCLVLSQKPLTPPTNR